MPIAEDIGGVSVSITGDLTDLQAAFSDAQTLAEKSGTETASAFNEAAGGADNLTHSTGDLLKTFAEFTGIAVGVTALREMATEGIELSNQVERATIAIGALRDGAESAAGRIDQLRATADQFGIAFEPLLGVEQKFAALGYSIAESQDAMYAAIEAAAALNSTTAETANALDRMALSGMAGARQLVALGLNVGDLARVMGVAEDQVKKTFAAMDQESRLAALELALQKFNGTAEAVAETFSGRWQKVKNDFNETLESIGSGLKKVAIAGEEALTILKAVNALTTGQLKAPELNDTAELQGWQNQIAAMREQQTVAGGVAAAVTKLADSHAILAKAQEEVRKSEAAITESLKNEAIDAEDFDKWMGKALLDLEAFQSLVGQQQAAVAPMIDAPSFAMLMALPLNLDHTAESAKMVNLQMGQFASTFHGVVDQAGNVSGKFQELTKQMEMVNSMFRSMGTDIAQGIVQGQSFGDIWHKVWTTFASDILGVVMQAVTQLVEKLIGVQALMAALDLALGIGTGGGGGVTGFSAMIGGHFAEGGPVPHDMLAMVHGGEYVTPASQVAAGNYGPAGSGGGTMVNMTVHMHGATSDLVDDVMNQMVKSGRRAGVNF